MKRTKRLGAMIRILTGTPCKLYPLKYFVDMFNTSKASISEDIVLADETLRMVGDGRIETVLGAKGGVRFIPDISESKLRELQEELCERIRDGSRIVGGGFLYTSDIMFDARFMHRLAVIFVRKFKDSGANYVATLETKGICLASMVALQMDLPMVIIRREAKVSEGSTVSINYFSGSYDRIQRMSLSKRAAAPGSKAVIIDDFMRGGGSVRGMADILDEFGVKAVGTGVAIVSLKPEKKKVDDYTALVYLGEVNEKNKTIEVYPNRKIFDHTPSPH